MIMRHTVWINPYTRVDFNLYIKNKDQCMDFGDNVIKDRNSFIVMLLGMGEIASNRTIDLWEKISPFLDWGFIKDVSVKVFGFIPECINCSTETYFVFDKYPDYRWINQIAETIKTKDNN